MTYRLYIKRGGSLEQKPAGETIEAALERYLKALAEYKDDAAVTMIWIEDEHGKTPEVR